VFSRYAGENDDFTPIKGDYYLSADEEKILGKIKEYYSDVTVIYNVGSFLDFSFTECKEIKSVVMAYLPGTAGANGLGRILKGTVSPQGKLPMTIAKNYDFYPSSKVFGAASGIMQKYVEDIYVGYRYFYTVPGRKNEVLYPFGHGLSYARFVYDCIAFNCDDKTITVKIKVKNVSTKYSSKETIMLYSSSPKTKLGNEKYALRAFAKTKMLAPGKSQILTLRFNILDMSSFDDTGVMGQKDCWVLKNGSYKVYFGNSIDKIKVAGIYKNSKTVYSEKCTHIDTELESRLNSSGEYEELVHIEPNPKEGLVVDPVKNNVFTGRVLTAINGTKSFKRNESFDVTLKVFKVGKYRISLSGAEKTGISISRNGLPLNEFTVLTLGNNIITLTAEKDMDLSGVSLDVSRNSKPISIRSDKATSFEAGEFSGNALYVVTRPFVDTDGLIKNGTGAARLFKPGRYVEYEINVEKSGIYNLFFRYCNYSKETDFSDSFTLLVSNVKRDINGVKILHTSEEDKPAVYKTAGPIKIELPEGLSILKLLSNTTQAPVFAYFTLERTNETHIDVCVKKSASEAVNTDEPVRVKHTVNPITNIYDLRNVLSGKISLKQLVDDLSPEELAHLTGGNEFGTVGYLPDRGIPEYMWSDGGCGLRLTKSNGNITNYPSQNMLCSSWNEDLAFEQGNSVARELVYENIELWLSPAMNIQRNVLCGRSFEYFSEDPFVTGKMAAAICRGVARGGADTDIKHYLANSTEFLRLQSNSIISARAIREIYAKGFEISIKEGHPDSIMTSYNYINGVKAAEHKGIISGMLRKEFKYKGVVLTDFGNDSSNVKELLAGSDLKMPRGESESVTSAIKDGTIPIAAVRKSSEKVLKMIMKHM
ncbi:MAG: glycoside hydrolase family 3 C-terminal domain-containing protein, partial [Clostridiales bacterium]|nr:glycoside hydrolase family 3 C-terminal domain-containing protein [Clostridiales bacterium]